MHQKRGLRPKPVPGQGCPSLKLRLSKKRTSKFGRAITKAGHDMISLRCESDKNFRSFSALYTLMYVFLFFLQGSIPIMFLKVAQVSYNNNEKPDQSARLISMGSLCN